MLNVCRSVQSRPKRADWEVYIETLHHAEGQHQELIINHSVSSSALLGAELTLLESNVAIHSLLFLPSTVKSVQDRKHRRPSRTNFCQLCQILFHQSTMKAFAILLIACLAALVSADFKDGGYILTDPVSLNPFLSNSDVNAPDATII